MIPALIMIVIRPVLILVVAATGIFGFAGICRLASLGFAWIKLHH